MDMDGESELFKILNGQYNFNELVVYTPIHGSSNYVKFGLAVQEPLWL